MPEKSEKSDDDDKVKEKKGKKAHKNKLTSKKYKHYAVEGDSIKRLRKHCPRCGPGTFLGDNIGRVHCGKCHYTEFTKKE